MDCDVQSCLKHQRIIANAGSGKTHRLTTRYIELLERGVPAENIVALTFTRKAAGEFLDAIFDRLLKASGSEAEARTLGRETGMPTLTSERCLGHLRQLVEKLPLLTLGTLDSFFGRILRAFPFECGLAGELAILDDHVRGVLRRQVLADVFRDQIRDEKGFAEFLDLIRQQSRNREGRDVSGTLDRAVEDLHERFLLTPPDKPWGDPSGIWPLGGSPLIVYSNILNLVEEFEKALFHHQANIDVKQREGWVARFREIRALKAGSPASDKLISFAVRALDPPVDRSRPGHFTLSLGKVPFRLPNRLRELAVALGRAILGLELEGRLGRSLALYKLLARFEARYQVLVRDDGQLTFLDVAGLLAAAGGISWGAKSLESFSRQEINFRLDSSYDHWLLDEFQDTSRLQWQALHDLVDEVIQSDSGRRSFFYVGDTKQAIYTWRGGDPRLFDEVSDFYNASGTGRIDTHEALDVSFRSAPEILDAVNTIFSPGHLQRLAATLEFSGEVLDRWRSAWRHHEPHQKSLGLGYFEWRLLDTPLDGSRVALDDETARLIKEVDPLAKGWSCAVLMRTNPRILTVIDALRRAGLPATSEGRIFPCQDSDLSAAILAFLRFVAHPNDTLSGQHLMMTPLGELVVEDPDEARRFALKKMREAGFHGIVTWLLEKLDLAAKPYARARAEELLIAASQFDAGWRGRAGVDEFVSFARGYESSEYPADKTIRVLTMHAAKGLDFDMVVLPDIDGRSFSSPRDSAVHLHQGADGQVQWGLELPPEKVCNLDPVLAQAWEEEAAEACYENLCLSYVAITRAKRALYILSRKLDPKSDRKDFNRLLHETFGRAGIASGDPNWHRQVKKSPPIGAQTDLSFAAGPRRRSPSPLRPSQAGLSLINAASLFSDSSARTVGSEVHRTLAAISWADEGWPELSCLSAEAAALISNFLRTSTAARLFARPAGPCSLWREKAFDVALEGEWISGVFDRVVIYQDESGQPLRAAIYDFKTDEADLAETYSQQMALYRKSLAFLIGLPEPRLSSTLIAIRTGEEIPVQFPGHLVQMDLL
jgi:ATP-dependent helicase/nuclease subunit A